MTNYYDMLLQTDSSRPWVIARLGVNSKSRIVSRFANRQDADDSLRMIHKFTARHVENPGATFVVCFVPPDELS